MNFSSFKEKLNYQFAKMAQATLFYVDINKDILWDTYLASFPEGTNPLYKGRTKHDCQCCKQFIRNAGHVVTIERGTLTSIWDVIVNDEYQVVADYMAQLVKQFAIKNVFLSTEANLGTDHTHQQLEEDSVKTWKHFHYKLPPRFVMDDKRIGAVHSSNTAYKKVLERSINELTPEAVKTIFELIEQNSIYHGAEYKSTVELLIKLQTATAKLPVDWRDTYYWKQSAKLKNEAKIKNTVISTLIKDISIR